MTRSHCVSRRRLRPLARLRRELETFRTVADFTYDWEIWLDPTGAARYVSPSCRRITGFEPGEVLCDPLFFHRIIHPDDLPGWLAAMRDSREKAAPSLDFRIIRKDGTEAWLAQETTRVLSPAGIHQGLRLSLRDVTERVEAQRALREARELLEERVLARTRDLELSRERYRALSAYLQERIEEERTRISREIHDELGQNLTALNMGLYRLEKGAAGRDPEAARHLAGLKELVAATLESVRRISRELRPPILDELGFGEAVAWRARTFRESTGIAVDVKPGRPPRLSPDAATALYRVLQEALTNVARHSGADRVVVRLERSRESFIMTIADDGRGISTQALESPDSFGIIGMRERARSVGGEMDIAAREGGGTSVSVRLPLPAGRRRKP
ncbi:PAS domain-containing sensor histidine kinase [Fundidesulfovibrio putealis]|uniref:PAS domain-containing sensor histidine kinase n=1 Tax=Fundidesulfovibrio putealis TaxID=270496 RepID=UPI0004098A3A|nr:histidine kinase [Fundidesulfovibrio putealis]